MNLADQPVRQRKARLDPLQAVLERGDASRNFRHVIERNTWRLFEDLMRALLVRSASGPLKVASVPEVVEQVGGKRLRDLVDRGVSTRNSLDPARYLRELGLSVTGQTYAESTTSI